MNHTCALHPVTDPCMGLFPEPFLSHPVNIYKVIPETLNTDRVLGTELVLMIKDVTPEPKQTQ